MAKIQKLLKKIKELVKKFVDRKKTTKAHFYMKAKKC